MEYRGTFEDLKTIVCKAGYEIIEVKLLPHHSPAYQIKTRCGGIVTWYEKTKKVVFQGTPRAMKKLVEDLALYIEETPTTSSPKIASNIPQAPSKKIFIVHGHDHVALEQLELILRRLDLEPFILKDTGGNGLTLIEALEKEICETTRSTKFGIVLLTPDDMGYVKTASAETAQPRARQNVILEMGMLISALTRKNVAILQQKGVESPSDIGGVYYLSFDKDVKETFSPLIKRLKAAGFSLNADAITDAL